MAPVVKAVILAAGRGSRMKALTADLPKCLLEFRGKPLLQWQLDALRGAGLNDVGIVQGYRGDTLAPYGLYPFVNGRWAETQMVSSLACADEWLSAGPCIVSYSDIFYSTDAVTSLMRSNADVAITYDPDWLAVWGKRFENPLDDAESFRIDKDSRILEIGAKPKMVEEVQGQYMGLLKFQPRGWHALKEIRLALPAERRDLLDMTSALQMLIGSGIAVEGVPVLSEWGEMDSESDIAKLS